MAKQPKAQKRAVGRVMHEFKHGELRSGGRRKVRNPKQAIAIALSEAGASRKATPSRNSRSERRTKQKERRGETGQARARRKMGVVRGTAAGREQTRAQLYEKAKRRNIPGRSTMTKAQLARALRS